jgi:hypothetical protein
MRRSKAVSESIIAPETLQIGPKQGCSVLALTFDPAKVKALAF